MKQAVCIVAMWSAVAVAAWKSDALGIGIVAGCAVVATLFVSGFSVDFYEPKDEKDD